MILNAQMHCRDTETIRVRMTPFFIGILFMGGLAGVAVASNDAVPTTAERLIDDAGLAKSDGKVALAYSLLHEAVRIAPENSLARWQLGQVKIDGEWLAIEEAQRRADADPRQAQYSERKQQLGESPQGQLTLARWCRNNKLADESQFHWASVLSVDPTNREALRAVGRRWHQGELLTTTEVRESIKETNEAKQGSRRWAPRVAAWLRALSDKYELPPDAIVNEIRAVDDLAAIPAFESVTLNERLSPNEKKPGPRRLSLAFLGALNEMREEEATDSLLRYAVLSPFDDVRGTAIGELRYRPLHDYVPKLLDGLAAPIQSAYQVVNDPDGSVHYLHALYREGPFADWSYRSQRSIYQPASISGVLANFMPTPNSSNVVNIGSNNRSGSVTPAGARRSARGYEQEIMAGEQQVAQTNQTAAALNERIVAVLTGTTGQSLGSQPRAWWNWWQDYTDYYRDGERPVYSTEDNSNDYVRPPAESVAVECFARGTPVWTKTGQRPIESLQIGDLVLSQNVNTGEIRYKPVLARTLRPAGPIVQISSGGEKLLATRGHPLWVDGIGWRMAKELGDGAMLHSLAGSGRVDAMRPAADAETYNLVVADFNTYFVGASGILAHDNTPRRPTQTIVPGIIAKK